MKKEPMKQEDDSDTNYRWGSLKSPKENVKEIRPTVAEKKNWGHSVHSTTKIDWVTIKNPGDPRRKTISDFHDTIYQPLRSGRIWHKVNF